ANKGIAHTNKPVFNYRSNSLSITSSGNDLEKMHANMQYAQWLRDFLKNHVPHESEKVVYTTLLNQQGQLMRRRKQYTMMLSMRSNPMAKCWMWYRHHTEFGLRFRDIVASAVKSREQRKR